MWERIKNILAKNNGTCIIVEDGRPAYVVSHFEPFEELVNKQAASGAPAALKTVTGRDEEIIEKVNQEIADWNVKQAVNGPEVNLTDVVDNDELKVENLPFV